MIKSSLKSCLFSSKTLPKPRRSLNTKCYPTIMILLLKMTMISIILYKMRATPLRVTGLYLFTAADKARQRPWRRSPGSKAARQAGDRLVTAPRRGFEGPQGPHGCHCHGAIIFLIKKFLICVGVKCTFAGRATVSHSLRFFLKQVPSFINVFFTFFVHFDTTGIRTLTNSVKFCQNAMTTLSRHNST